MAWVRAKGRARACLPLVLATGLSVEQAGAEENPARHVLFASFDGAERGHFAGIGWKRALGGTLDAPGFRLMIATGAKLRDRDPVTGQRGHRVHATRSYLGREFRLGPAWIGLYAGTSAAAFADPEGLGRARTRLGAAGLIDLHLELAQPWKLHAVASGDSATRSVYARLRPSVALGSGPMRIGPEASASLGRTRALGGIRVQSGWRKARAGLHLAEIPLGPVRFTASGGVEWETGEHPGAYGGLSAYWRF